MKLEPQKHEKIRFRRDEICDLDALPSAIGQDVPRAPRPAPSRISLPTSVVRIAAKSVAVVLGLLILAVLGIYAVAASGLGTERLRMEAEAALRRVAGPDVAASMGPASIALDGAQFLSLKVVDFGIEAGGRPQVEAGSLRFGLRLLPLLGGQLKLGSVKISNARIHASALSLGRTGDWTSHLRNEDGLIDPDLAGEALFNALHGAMDLLQHGGTQRIDLENTEIVLAEAGRIRSLMIDEASLSDRGGGLGLSAEGTLDGRRISLDGKAVHDSAAQRVTQLNLRISVAPSEPLVLDSAGLLSTDGSKSRLGSAAIEISGAESDGPNPTKLALTADIDNSVIDLGRRGVVPGDADLAATLVIGSNKVEIDRLSVATGRSRIEATGAIGPQPRAAAVAGETPVYRYEFVTQRALLAPLDSPDGPTEYSARMAGRFDEHTRKLTADELSVRTGDGQLAGIASADFVPGKTPGLFLALSASDMPVAQAKQFWPWMAAGRARQWVIENFFGGRVVESQIQYRVAPGRIGDGVPLNSDEIFGRFVVRDSRFDTTGELPPIRDAEGVIEFRGNDVDIALSSGTAYLPSGKAVDVENGVLTFRNANINPVVGDLDIDLKGDAVAVAELASLKPIDAMRRLKMEYADFSGSVSGHVKTQLPLQKDADLAKLEWQVRLDVSNLAVAKPFDGQKLSRAKGTIRVDPRGAVLDLDGQLNDVPADMKIVEPLRDGGPARARDIRLTVDDKRRNQIAPGLNDIVAGTMVLHVDAADGDRQKVTADLAKARLSIPWVGWSKGPGIPAKLSFDMTRSGTNATLSNLQLSGETFGISGDVKLAAGALASARFDRVRLNRGDNAKVDITRRGKGYAVSVNGSSFDARSLIKLVLGDKEGGDGGSQGSAATVSVKASIASLAGFGGEALSGVELSYAGTTDGAATYAMSAVTGGGGTVNVSNDTDGGRQAMRVRAADAGAFVRFLDIYDKMRGGQVDLTLSGKIGGALRGQVNASGFQIVNEPRLGSIVSTKPAGSDRSLNEAVRRDIDTARVEFQRGFARVEKGTGYLALDGGVLRGPMVGATFQGTLYDAKGNIDMTGTFMPAYGLNRLFAELPIIGVLLGNGRDRGLIGVTFKLEGKAAKPQLQINPLSVIAPGIFRSIFEFQ